MNAYYYLCRYVIPGVAYSEYIRTWDLHSSSSSTEHFIRKWQHDSSSVRCTAAAIAAAAAAAVAAVAVASPLLRVPRFAGVTQYAVALCCCTIAPCLALFWSIIQVSRDVTMF